MKLATAAEMAAVDRCASETHGIPVSELMERAGQRTVEAVELLLGQVAGRGVALVCGCGNNGGDGFVAARLLLALGAKVQAVLVGPAEALRPEARRAWAAARAAGVDVTTCAEPSTLAAVRPRLLGAELVVDALLGTGFTPPARDPAQSAIRLVNSLGVPVLAVDIPSGLSAYDGRVSGEVVRAEATVTFGYPKPGLVLHPGARHAGRLWVAEIGFPAATDALVSGEMNLLTPGELSPHLGPRDPEGHKGTYGHVLIVAGSAGMAGAAVLAARGALRAGAGLVTAALPASVAPALLPHLPEAMLLPLPGGAGPGWGREAARALLSRLSRTDALAVGPGLSRGDAPSQLVRDLCVAAAELPLLLDADALHALAADGPEAVNSRNSPAVLTPHPGELARLVGTSAAEVQADRIAAARTCAERFNAVVVLKGARTVVAHPAGPVWINPTGNPGMAAAGMGDVLAGVITAHLARGMPPLAASLLGVYLHGRAGDIAVARAGPWGILASEVADLVPAALVSTGDRNAQPNAPLALVVP